MGMYLGGQYIIDLILNITGNLCELARTGLEKAISWYLIQFGQQRQLSFIRTP